MCFPSALERWKAICKWCGRTYKLDEMPWRCECGKPLSLSTDLGDIEFDPEELGRSPLSLWRYQELLPVKLDEAVSLGEPITPIIKLRVMGLESCFLKLEFLFPTGSFKDRGSCIMISFANILGVKKVVEDSSGNAGASVAAYCARAGISCRIFVPSNASGSKLLQIRAYGAEVIAKGSRNDAAILAMKEADRGIYYASHVWNPFFFEGTKTFAFEIWEQLGHVEPDALVLPVGHGTLLLGSNKGFSELRELGLINKIPRFFAVQAAGCSPLVDRLRESESNEISRLADGIMIRNPPRIDEMVKSVVKTGGGAITVSDEEIKESWKELASRGLFVEPTSATSLAGLKKLIEEGHIHRDEIVVIPLTGSGLKTPKKALKLLEGSS